MHNIGLAGSLLNKGKALGAGFMLFRRWTATWTPFSSLD